MKASCDFWPESCAPFVKQLNLIFYVKKEGKKYKTEKLEKKEFRARWRSLFSIFAVRLTYCVYSSYSHVI